MYNLKLTNKKLNSEKIQLFQDNIIKNLNK